MNGQDSQRMPIPGPQASVQKEKTLGVGEPFLTREQLFRMYLDLAARVTNLRTIIQNDPAEFGGFSAEDARVWAADVRSVAQDFMQLTELTRDYIKPHISLEPTDHATASPIS